MVTFKNLRDYVVSLTLRITNVSSEEQGLTFYSCNIYFVIIILFIDEVMRVCSSSDAPQFSKSEKHCGRRFYSHSDIYKGDVQLRASNRLPRSKVDTGNRSDPDYPLHNERNRSGNKQRILHLLVNCNVSIGNTKKS